MLGRAVARIRVLVADSSRIHTQLLSDALERDPSLNVVHWDCHPASVIPTIMAHNVDVLAVSSSMNGDSVQGLEFVRELRTVSPTTKAVVLLDSQKDDLVVNAFRAGARGLFSKDGSIEMFCRCIHTVFEGEIWADRRSIALAVNELASIPVVRAVGANGLNLLSKRELEVVQCVVQGLTNKEIADRLKLSHWMCGMPGGRQSAVTSSIGLPALKAFIRRA